MKCPECATKNRNNAKFCDECGFNFAASPRTTLKKDSSTPGFEGERKQATVMFSDLSGYTTMTEKLDPEEVKNLMGDIFKKAEGVVKKYGGTVERFFGDEVMILFGVPKAHEDDPVRAVHTALEIHKLVDELSPAFEKAHQAPLRMHTGINTGLVITGDEYIGKGRHGLTGDTINLAKRLTSLAAPGEIIMGPETHQIAQHHFSFETLPAVQVKGKQKAVQPFKVDGTIIDTGKTKQLKGVRADLIGRTNQLLQFSDAATRLKTGQGSIIYLKGTAGSGKSRLVEEFKVTTSLLWLEGFTYPYTKSTPYFPIISLFNHAMDLKENDSPGTLKKKIEKSIHNLIGDSKNIVPYIGELYSLDYHEISNVSPEFYKSKLFDAILVVVNAIALKTPTIICLEDLHWADPSSLELIRFITGRIEAPLIILVITRPVIELFSESDIEEMQLDYSEILIDDLNTTDAKTMVKSLLQSDDIPEELERFVENKAQGNPFYLEEIINSLIESGTLQAHENHWKVSGQISEAQISGSIHNVISSRIDRLEKESRKIIQEASVIGRSFYYKVIDHITETRKDIQHCLESLENLDLIKSRQATIDLEYIFKHALTQEVVYKGLLKAQRKVIHEKIGNVIEEVFQDRLPEFYETLAHHFSQGGSTLKAVNYLVKSGEKSLKRYSVDEAHNYFTQGYDLISSIPDPSPEIEDMTLDLINKWGLVFYYRGTFKDLETLLLSNVHLTEGKKPSEIVGVFLAWQGFVLEYREQFEKSEKYLKKALDIGEQLRSNKVIGYACAWLSFVSGELGKFDKGIEYGQRGYEIAKKLNSDPYITFKSLGGDGMEFFLDGTCSRRSKEK